MRGGLHLVAGRSFAQLYGPASSYSPVLVRAVVHFWLRSCLNDFPFCRPSNVNRRRRTYAPLAQVRVVPLYLSEKDLTVDRMLAIMGCDNLDVRSTTLVPPPS